MSLSFDDVRNFLLETNAISDAETVLLKNAMKRQEKEEHNQRAKEKNDAIRKSQEVTGGLKDDVGSSISALKITDLLKEVEKESGRIDNNDATNRVSMLKRAAIEKQFPQAVQPQQQTQIRKNSIDDLDVASSKSVAQPINASDAPPTSIEELEKIAQEEIWKLEKIKLSIQRQVEDEKTKVQQQQYLTAVATNPVITSSKTLAKQRAIDLEKSYELQKKILEMSTEHAQSTAKQRVNIITANRELEMIDNNQWQLKDSAIVARQISKTSRSSLPEGMESPLRAGVSSKVKVSLSDDIIRKARVEELLNRVKDDEFLKSKQEEIATLRNNNEEKKRLEAAVVTKPPTVESINSEIMASRGDEEIEQLVTADGRVTRSVPIHQLLDKWLASPEPLAPKLASPTISATNNSKSAEKLLETTAKEETKAPRLVEDRIPPYFPSSSSAPQHNSTSQGSNVQKYPQQEWREREREDNRYIVDTSPNRRHPSQQYLPPSYQPPIGYGDGSGFHAPPQQLQRPSSLSQYRQLYDPTSMNMYQPLPYMNSQVPLGYGSALGFGNPLMGMPFGGAPMGGIPGMGMGNLGMGNLGMGGIPMNAVANDPVTQQLQKLAQQLEQENAQLAQLGGGAVPGGVGGGAGLDKQLNQLQPQLPPGINPQYALERDKLYNNSDPNNPNNPLMSRLNREELRRQEEIRVIQHELEKMKHQRNLEEFKTDCDRQRILRQKEMEYSLWLEDQKRELQAVKMKQVLAKEQRLLQLQQQQQQQPPLQSQVPQQQMAPQIMPSADIDDGNALLTRIKDECGVGVNPLIALSFTALGLESNIKGLGVIVDALQAPTSFLRDALSGIGSNGPPTVGGGNPPAGQAVSGYYRVALGVYDASGKNVVRLIASDWQLWQATGSNGSVQGPPPDGGANFVGGDGLLSIQLLSPLLHRSWKFMNAINSSGNAANASNEFEELKKILLGAKCLMELQYKERLDDATVIQKSLGWSIFPLFNSQLINSQNNSNANNNNSSNIVMLSNNCWKVRLRKGISDPTANPHEDALPPMQIHRNVFFFVRIFDGAEQMRALNWTLASSGVLMMRKSGTGDTSNISPLMVDTILYTDPFEVKTAPQQAPQQPSVDKTPPRNVSSKGGVPPSPAIANIPQPSTTRPPSSSSKQTAPPTPLQQPPGSAIKPIPALEKVPEAPEEEPEPVAVKPNGMVMMKPAPSASQISNYWQLGQVLGPCQDRYQRGDGVDIYLDSARFLPDNCTASRLSLRIFTSTKEQIGPVYEEMSSLSSSSISPVFRMKVEYRGNFLNHTSTAILRVDTIDSSTMVPVCVGYAIIKLFANRDRVQPKQANEPNSTVYINSGAFQLPIYAGKFPAMSSVDAFNDEILTSPTSGGKTLTRVPCASLLVRILPAPKSSDGIATLSRDEFPRAEWVKLKLDIPAPDYNTGAYCGALCEPTPLETIAYEAKNNVAMSSSFNSLIASSSTSVASTAAQGAIAGSVTSAANAAPIAPSGVSMKGNSAGGMSSRVNDPAPAVSGPQPQQGVLTVGQALNQGMMTNKNHTLPPRPTQNVTDLAIERWLKSMFPPCDQVRRTLDYTLVAPYSVESGLNLCIQGLFNLPEPGGLFSSPNQVYKVVASLWPPALLYHDPPLFDGIYWTKNHDLDKSLRCPTFSDGYVTFTPAEMSFNLYVIFDIRMITVDPPNASGTAKKADAGATQAPTGSNGNASSGNNGNGSDAPAKSTANITVEPPSSRKSFWTALPLSRERCAGQGYRYLTSGFFQLPLIEGAVPTNGDFIKSPNPLREIRKRLELKNSKETKGMYLKIADGPSLLVKVLNPLLSTLLQKDIEDPERLPDTTVMQLMVDSASDGASGVGLRMEKFAYSTSKFAPGSKAVGKTLSQMLTSQVKGGDASDIIRQINSAFQNKTGLPNII